MQISDFDFDLPRENIALEPARPRDSARLLRVASGQALAEHRIADLPSLLDPGDLLIANDTAVIRAQLAAQRGEAKIGITLDRILSDGSWHALAKNARKLRPGDTLRFGADDITAEVVENEGDGAISMRFSAEGTAFDDFLKRVGALALPPYIDRPTGPTAQDDSDYATIFERYKGAVAAPTAGLHFTPELLAALDARGVTRHTLTLHVGAGTFLPVRDDIASHKMHAEWGRIDAHTAQLINDTRASGKKIIAVGTTSLRLLESAADENGIVHPWEGETAIFIKPGYRFRAVDRLMTNFHLPRSTLFMLVCALAGTDTMRAAYAHAIAEKFRFYSYGDACLLDPRAMTEHATKMQWKPQTCCGQARAGHLHTAHGTIPTPTFMPVGTVGTVKAMTMDAVRSTGAGIILGNTYHLMLRPGAERVRKMGGLHRMMDWSGPILTDSGGFQVMSLGALRKLDQDGVTFNSHIDGSKHRLTPQSSTDIQHALDATITMCFDECPALPATPERLESSMELSMRWAARSREAFVQRPGYGQFGIVQGGTERELRARSARALTDIGFEGYAIGGLAVGEGQELMFSTLDFTTPLLPQDHARYLMGVGTPDDLLGGIERGVDMFDCVMPTRAGRTARAYTERGTLNMRNARHAEDNRPISPDCDCLACSRHSRAYLHHLFRANEILGPMLLTWHNLAYYQRLMRQIRAAIVDGSLPQKAIALRADWAAGDWTQDEFPQPDWLSVP